MSFFPEADYTLEELHEMCEIDDQEYFDLKQKERMEQLGFIGRDHCYDLKPSLSAIEEFIQGLQLIYN